MTNLETISYYEKLHDLFERVKPADMPQKISNLIDYLEKAGKHHAVDVGDVTSILMDLQGAFEDALAPSKKAILLTNEERGYSVNIYPIKNFLIDHDCFDGDMDDLKSRLISLAHSANVAELKKLYSFIDDLSITFHA